MSSTGEDFCFLWWWDMFLSFFLVSFASKFRNRSLLHRFGDYHYIVLYLHYIFRAWFAYVFSQHLTFQFTWDLFCLYIDKTFWSVFIVRLTNCLHNRVIHFKFNSYMKCVLQSKLWGNLDWVQISSPLLSSWESFL